MRHIKRKKEFNNIYIFIGVSLFFSLILIGRLFQLQVLQHNYFQDIATREQFGFVELPAQRGDIIIRDHHSEEEFLLATNTTLNLVYADPFLIEDPNLVGQTLAPLLFDIESERELDLQRIEDQRKNLPIDLTEEEVEELLKPKSDEQLAAEFKENLITKLGQKQRPEIQLTNEVDLDKITQVNSLGLSGIETRDDNKIYAKPSEIGDKKSTAEKLSSIVEIPSAKLENILDGDNRYVVLKRKLHPDISDQIQDLQTGELEENFRGIGMTEEYYRFYPEQQVAANVVGYINHESIGQYGIESSFNNQLQGKKGKFQTKRDSLGRQITVGDSIIEKPVDGSDIVLTIDRSVQMKVEEILDYAVWAYRADSAQAIVMDPKTGAILAMGHSPRFNPNTFGEVFTKVDAEFTPEQIEELYPAPQENQYYYYTNDVTLDKYTVFEEKDEFGNTRYLRYENFVGPEVYHNKIISWPYEPGSVFKTIAMAIAIDDGDVTPNTTYNDVEPVGVDWNPYTEDYDFYIKNSAGHLGLVDMNTVLAESLNTGMTFVAKRIGPALFYSYLEKFGFLDRTDIELDNEAVGKIDYFEDWTESELATHSFGQGITVTMLQLANAYSAIANGGILMQPYVIEEVRHDDGTITVTEPHEIRRVISEETSNKMQAMLIYAVEEGVAGNAQTETHRVAGKTGTSQTYKNGQALSGSGTTITSFAGFGPVSDPQFVVLVKIDKPKSSEWGSDTAAPTFAKIASFMMDYYNIPPDK